MIEGLNKKFSKPLALKLKDVGWITPDLLTFGALAVALLSASAVAFLPSGGLVPALLFLFSNFLDSLDGDLARVRGQTTKRGALLDAVLDRVSDISILFAMAHTSNEWLWGYLSVLGSVLVPYTRAKAEALGVEKEKLKTFGSRDIRNTLIFLGLLFSAYSLTLKAVAILSLASAVHRLYRGMRYA